MTTRTPRLSQPKLWNSLAIAGTAFGLATAPLAAQTQPGFAAGSIERLWLASSEGGEAGEGGASVTDADGQALPMVTQLGLLEGALRAGAELAKAGDAKTGAGHVDGLINDRYEPVEADLAKYNAPAFESELTAAIDAITAGAAADEIAAATDKALAGIAAARAADYDPKEWFAAIQFLTLKAGEEYGKGVKDGKLADAGEYQESWGNLQAALVIATALAASADEDENVKSAATTAVTVLTEVNAAFAGIKGDGALRGDESLFAAAAAKIELAAFKVK